MQLWLKVSSGWVISELGMFYAGAISVPLSVKLAGPSEIGLRLEHSGARMIVVSQSQVKKIQDLKDKLNAIEKIVLLIQKLHTIQMKYSMEIFSAWEKNT